MKTDYTINEVQAGILTALQSVEPLTLALLATYTSASNASFTRAQLDLRLREFVTAQKTLANKPLQLYSTAQGTIALNWHNKKRELLARQPVAQTRINRMELPVWQPQRHGIPSMLDMGTSRSFGATA